MKFVIFAVVLFLFGCDVSPKYSVGDCFMDNNELDCEFECPESYKIRKILKVGKTHYQYMIVIPHTMRDYTHEFNIKNIDQSSIKTECPLE